jgi:hypothetical protein
MGGVGLEIGGWGELGEFKCSGVMLEELEDERIWLEKTGWALWSDVPECLLLEQRGAGSPAESKRAFSH